MKQNNVTPRFSQLSEEIRDIQLVQLTDCHILRDPQAELKGVNTRHSFEKVFSAVQKTVSEYDLVLATGDLSQDESPESYIYLAEKFNLFDLPVAWIPGNHDDPETMGKSFCADHILTARHILISNWQVVLLDSSLPGEVHGLVSESQLQFMHQALQDHQQNALVCLHHPAIFCGSAWMDRKSLLEADRFRNAVCQHANVRGVLWGHVHQEAHFRRNSIDWMSTPSTCIQFKPDSAEFALDTRPPGYRSLSLKVDGSIESEVIRVD